MHRKKSSSNPGNLGAYIARQTVRQKDDFFKKRLLNKRDKKKKEQKR